MIVKSDILLAEHREGAQVVAIDELHCSVDAGHPDEYNKVKKHIQEEGLTFPIVAAKMYPSEWKQISDQSPLFYPPPTTDETKQNYFVTCGNNRLRIAKELGYRYIDAIIVPGYEAGSEHCKKFRKWWDKLNGRRNRE